MNRFSKLCALCVALFVSITAFAGDLSKYQFPDWNDYEITFNDPNGYWNSNDSYIYVNIPVGETREIKFNVMVDEDATFTYRPSINTHCLKVYLDDNEIENFTWDELYSYSKIRFIEMSPGTHCISISVSRNGSGDGSKLEIYDIGVSKTPTISVNLLEPGSLGTEVLYNVESLQDVRKLKIRGELNSDDWDKISMMSANLFTLDLSGAIISTVPNSLFSSKKFIHEVKLPEGVVSIGSDAFNSTPLRSINFPASLRSIGASAFNRTYILEAIMGENCTSLGGSVFSGCTDLKKVRLSSRLSVIPSSAFSGCSRLHDIELHEGIRTIEEAAFYTCFNFHPQLPETLQKIGRIAFAYCNNHADYSPVETSLVVPDNVNFIGNKAFDNSQYTHITLPINYNTTGTIYPNEYSYEFLPATTKVLRLKCPTVIKLGIYNTGHGNGTAYPISYSYRTGDITLQVPDFLVPSYKLDSYWYNFGKIEGFSTEEVDNWVIKSDLLLGAHDRMLGTPSITITEGGGSLKISGTDAMPLNNLIISIDPDNKLYGRIFSNADGVTVAGNLDIHLRAGTNNRWYFMNLPYNIKVSDINFLNNNPKRAIRYYDGASRAENGTGGNWKNFSEDDIIPAGTGFISQVSEAGWWNFPAQNDASKQYMTSTRMFVKQLEANTSAVASNHGWNLVGNPYQCWYNIHKINFTAPITVRNDRYNGYEAYSIIDDDYALAPNQAFFVQCPTGTTEISFPLEGRQMTSTITSQNGAPARNPQAGSRQLIDVVLSNGIDSDRTRVVMNPEAGMDYELTCDAGKFMSEAAIPQLYTLDDNGEEYAINERPLADGKVQMGIVIPAAGKYTISITRNGARKVMLQDNETGDTVDITATGYEFQAEAGTSDTRFTLIVEGNDATGIAAAAGLQSVGVYTVSGIKVPDARNLPSGTYIVKSAQGKVSKINVK